MVRAKTLGLVGAGKFSDSPLSRMLAAGVALGPVKAPSLRVASRIANTLRTGYPVPEYQQLEQCSLILISVPDKAVMNIVAELASHPLTWARKTVILCSSVLGSEKLSPLAAQGAQTGSLSLIPGFEDRWLLLEGEKPVELQIGKFLDVKSRRLTVIRPLLKPFYLAALACTGPMLTPMLITAAESLQKAGVSSVQISALIEKQVGLSVRAYLKAGRKALRWPGEIGELSQRLASLDAALARYLDQTLETARMVAKAR
ncbi:MAG: hypothetical protein M3Z32_06485 [Acidobacteriota bacterium]|nr:hypothetical protein [Acidobacteriota bacterium]